MKILHITSPGNKTAGKLAFDIHDEILNKGYKSYIVSKGLNSKIKFSYSFYNVLINWVEHKFQSILIHYNSALGKTLYTDRKYSFLDLKEDRSQYRYKKILDKVPFTPDVIILYAMQNFINVKTINMMYKKTKAKIFWLLYDIAPLTGGCHYSWGCKNYVHKCGFCPVLVNKKSYDISRENWLFKNKYTKDVDINILPCTEWLFNKAVESSLFKNKPIYKWMIPMDKSYKYLDKKIAKKQLELNIEKIYVMFGAVKATGKRKGLNYLIEAFKIMKKEKMTSVDFDILVLGRQEDFNSSEIPFKVHNVGFINERDILIKYYQAAYIVIVPSIEDAGPLMISEAITCGTPVVSFEMGSALDLVHSGITGYRAELKNCHDLAKGISRILDLNEAEYSEMSENCIKIAEEKLNMDKQIDKLIEIFEINS